MRILSVSSCVLVLAALVGAACGGSEASGDGSGLRGSGGTSGISNVACTGDGTCAQPFPYCATALGRCVECLDDPNCGDGRRCDTGTHACVECLGDGDCGGGEPYCDVASRRCVECQGNANCGGGEVCDAATGSCRPGCTSSADCSPADGTPYCAPRGVCVECLESANCPSDEPACSAVGRCIECVDDTACGGENPYCDVQRGRCTECLTDLNCPSGEWCDVRELQCTGG